MSEKKNQIPEDSGLDDQLRRLGEGIGAPSKLKEAAKSGAWIGANSRNSTSMHVRKFAHAALAYAGCVAVLVGCILFVPRLLGDGEGNSPLTQVSQPLRTGIGSQITDPATTEEPTAPDYGYPEDYYRPDLIWANEEYNPYRLNAKMIGTVSVHFDFETASDARYAVYLEYNEKNSEDAAQILRRIAIDERAFEVTTDHVRVERQGTYYALTSTEIMKIGRETPAYSIDIYLGYQSVAKEAGNIQNPKTGDSLSDSLQGMINLNEAGKVDFGTLRTMNFIPWNEQEENIAQLFDTIDRPEEMETSNSGQCGGMVNTDTAIACFLFGLDERETLGGYVITTAAQASVYPGRNPVEWSLYATNDPSVMESEELHLSEWTLLDSVYDGKIADEDCVDNGYVIDEDCRGEYQYYCWYVSCVKEAAFQVSELSLYAIPAE